MTFLILGANGQVGWELQRACAPLAPLVALTRAGQDGLSGDLSQPDAVIQTIRTLKPSVIINAGAYTAVDKAESDQDTARAINTHAPHFLAEEARRHDALLVHYSTDYVFDGTGQTPWKETDPTAPINFYGLTKRDGETAIQDSGCHHLIFRTSWVYGARGNNFAKTMLRLGMEREALTVINDQTGAPTGADLLADVTAHCIRTALKDPKAQGLYHLAAGGETTWFDYARFVLEIARQKNVTLKIQPHTIKPVPTAHFPTPAKRPHNSRLDTTTIQKTFELQLPSWQNGVKRMLNEVLEP